MAKIDPETLRAVEPKPRRPSSSGVVTPGRAQVQRDEAGYPPDRHREGLLQHPRLAERRNQVGGGLAVSGGGVGTELVEMV